MCLWLTYAVIAPNLDERRHGTIVIGASSNIQDDEGGDRSKSSAAVTIERIQLHRPSPSVVRPCEVGNQVFIGFSKRAVQLPYRRRARWCATTR